MKKQELLNLALGEIDKLTGSILALALQIPEKGVNTDEIISDISFLTEAYKKRKAITQ